MVSGHICLAHVCLAHGSDSFVCTRRIPMVSSLAAAISVVGLDTADHHLDCEHYPHIRPMALARTWASVGVASWLGNAGRIWMRRSGRCNSRLAQGHTTDGAMLNQRGPVMCTAPDTN